MMKKLAVTVFVLSLAAIGCGSDSGTPKKDSGTDAKGIDTQSIDVQVKTDLSVTVPDAPVGNEVQPDMPAPLDMSVDQVIIKPVDTNPLVDVQPGEVQKPVDVATPDKPINPPIDGPKPVDVQPTEAAQPVDGGVDGSVG
jgi:hypothetical protein